MSNAVDSVPLRYRSVQIELNCILHEANRINKIALACAICTDEYRYGTQFQFDIVETFVMFNFYEFNHDGAIY